MEWLISQSFYILANTLKLSKVFFIFRSWLFTCYLYKGIGDKIIQRLQKKLDTHLARNPGINFPEDQSIPVNKHVITSLGSQECSSQQGSGHAASSSQSNSRRISCQIASQGKMETSQGKICSSIQKWRYLCSCSFYLSNFHKVMLYY